MLRWNAREALVAFVERLRRAALADYRHETLVWALLAPHSKKKMEPPKVPRVLGG